MPNDRTIWLLAVLTVMLLIASTAGCSLEYTVRHADNPEAAGDAAIQWWVCNEL